MEKMDNIKVYGTSNPQVIGKLHGIKLIFQSLRGRTGAHKSLDSMSVFSAPKEHRPLG